MLESKPYNLQKQEKANLQPSVKRKFNHSPANIEVFPLGKFKNTPILKRKRRNSVETSPDCSPQPEEDGERNLYSAGHFFEFDKYMAR